MLEFSRLGLEHKEKFNKVVKKHNYHNSESSFISLFLWSESEKIEIAFGEHAIFLRFMSEEDKLLYFSPFLYDMKEGIKPAIMEIRKFLHKENERFCVTGLIREYRDMIEHEFDDFLFTDNRDNYDYVFLSETLINLSGKKLSAKRNHINYFLNNYEYEYKRYDVSMKQDCLDLMHEWYDDREGRMLMNERIILDEILNTYEQLGLVGACIYVEGKMQAITFGEALTSETALIHIEKANPDIRGLYPFINQQFVKNEWSNFKYINREEDLGIEGLRKAKLSYYPEFLVEKFTCSLDGKCYGY